MRRMDTPIASRWAHIALRNALLAKSRAPRAVNPIDWVAERAWLLLRLGEADAARMLVADVDTDRFTPKLFQVGVQSALANGDPPALCPLQDGIRKYEPAIRALVSAMCASLSGEPESASAQIDDARRRGRIGGIDLMLAEKVVGAGANTGAVDDDRMGPGRSPDRVALRARHRHRHGAARSAGPRRLAAVAGVRGAGAAVDGRPAARIGARRDRARRVFVPVDDRPLFDDLRFDRPQRPARNRRLASPAGLRRQRSRRQAGRDPQVAGRRQGSPPA